MSYYKFIGDKVSYGLVADLAAYDEVIVYIIDRPTWAGGKNWKELSNVELLIEFGKKTPIFSHCGKHIGGWVRKEEEK